MIEQGVGAADATAPRTMTPHLQERSAPTSDDRQYLGQSRRRRSFLKMWRHCSRRGCVRGPDALLDHPVHAMYP